MLGMNLVFCFKIYMTGKKKKNKQQTPNYDDSVMFNRNKLIITEALKIQSAS